VTDNGTSIVTGLFDDDSCTVGMRPPKNPH